ncbi:MAG: hypothetical protein KDA60_16525, partial [Planctomycetales bacterium]|nr:hypothetical protein [Planctomycetales bacterium]
MPELPEVETMRRGLSPVINSRICRVLRPRCACRPIEVSPDWDTLRRRVKGRTIVAIDR